MSKLITNSRLKSFSSCQKKHEYRYVLGYRKPFESPAINFGVAFHMAMEHWWMSMPNPNMEDGIKHARVFLLQHTDQMSELVRLETLLRAYHEHWKQETYETLAVEIEFTHDIEHPFDGTVDPDYKMAGKMDGLVKYKGEVYVLEHKTTSRDFQPTASYWRELLIDSQISAYLAGARSLGYSPAGVIYDVAKRPGHRQRAATKPESQKRKRDGSLYSNQREKDESPAELGERIASHIRKDPTKYFARQIITRDVSEELRHREDVFLLTQQIKLANVIGAPRNRGACMAYNSECDFYGVCIGEHGLEHEDFIKSVPHSELNEVTKEKT